MPLLDDAPPPAPPVPPVEPPAPPAPDDAATRVRELERQVRVLSLALRLGLVVLLAIYGFRCVGVLACAPHFAEMFKAMGLGGLPLLTQLVLACQTPLLVAAAALAVTGIIVLLLVPRPALTVPVGVAITLFLILLAETAMLAYYQPLFAMLQRMSASN